MFSSGKSIAAIVVAMMVDKGLLSYERKVMDYWPEFGKNDKSDITVADVLRHESGLQDFDYTLNKSDFSRQGVKSNVMSDIIENLEPFFPTKELGISNPDGTETRRAYHALSRGWILNEVVRRVDPQQRTIGEIIENDIGIDGLRCGMSDEDLKNTSQLTAKSITWLLRQCFTPKGTYDKLLMGLMYTYTFINLKLGLLELFEFMHYQLRISNLWRSNRYDFIWIGKNDRPEKTRISKNYGKEKTSI